MVKNLNLKLLKCKKNVIPSIQKRSNIRIKFSEMKSMGRHIPIYTRRDEDK